MSFRHSGDATEGLRSKRLKHNDDRRLKREYLLKQKRLEEEAILSKKEREEKLKVEMEKKEFIRNKYSGLEEKFYNNLCAVCQKPSEENLFIVFEAIAESCHYNPEIKFALYERVVPITFNCVLMFFNEPLIQQVYTTNDRLFKSFARLLSLIIDIDLDTLKVLEKLSLVEITFKLLFRGDDVINIVLDVITAMCVSPYFSTVYLERGILQSLVGILSSTQEPLSMYRHTAIIFNTISNQSHFNEEYILQYIPLFSKLFSIDDEDVRSACISAATALFSRKDFVDELRPVKIPEICLETLATTRNEILIVECLKCLGSYCYFKDDIVLFPQIIEAVVSKLSTTNEDILRRGYWMLSNISVSAFQENQKMIISSGAFLSACRVVIDIQNTKIRGEAAWVLANTLCKLDTFDSIRSDVVYEALSNCIIYFDNGYTQVLLQGLIKFVAYDNTLEHPEVADGLVSHRIMDNLDKMMHCPSELISQLSTSLCGLIQKQRDL